MKLDIKIPIGLLFTIFGLILVVFGLFTGSDSTMYAKSLDINVNIWTGVVMLVFGIFMLFLSRRGKK